SQSDHSAAIWMTSALLSVGVVIAVGAMAFSFFGIARPIGRITRSMAVLADGDTKAEVPFAARRDEIGEMAGAVKVFRDSMIRTRELEAEAQAAEERAVKQRKAEMHRLARDFEAAVGGIINSVSSTSTELEAAA